MDRQWECLDGNEAAARVAYALSEVISILPGPPKVLLESRREVLSVFRRFMASDDSA